MRVKTLIGLERFEVDKTRAFSLDPPEIPEITEILEMGLSKEGHHGNTRNPGNSGNGGRGGVGCIENCFEMLSQTSCGCDFFPLAGAVL